MPECDHRDCDKGNNRWTNLREATHSQNNANRRIWKNRSGVKGVRPIRSKWQAWLYHKKKLYVGPLRGSIPEASVDYEKLALQYHGEFART